MAEPCALYAHRWQARSMSTTLHPHTALHVVICCRRCYARRIISAAGLLALAPCFIADPDNIVERVLARLY